MKKTIFKWTMWILAIAWAGVLFLLSGQNAAESSELSMGVTQILIRLFPALGASTETLHIVVRKLAHFSGFLMEGFLLWPALHMTLPAKRPSVRLTMAVCVVMAVLNELYQCFSEGRSCEVRDMCIDSAGAFLGIGIAVLLMKLFIRHQSRRQNVIIS